MTAEVTHRDYREISAEKRSQRQAQIPKEWILSKSYDESINVMDVPTTCGLLSELECDITSNHDATALLEGMKRGKWSAEQVTTAFCKRAAIAQQLTNCLTEIFFDQAIAHARTLDLQRLQNPSAPLRPLHGLPISLKDNFAIAGHDTTTGLACFASSHAPEHSSLAALLLSLGAVLYCKTNLCQSIMTGDSHNNVFGRTLNPRNHFLTAGGSTGGEGALLALRGSVLGVGTDIGGSARVPAVCTGIYGYRPSEGIVPHGGVRELTKEGMAPAGVKAAAAPMAGSLRDVRMFMETVMRAESWRFDSTVTSIPWMDYPPKDRLRIGVARDDGMHTPTPPVRRALQETVERLRASGHVELVELTLPHTKQIYTDLIQYFALTDGSTYTALLALTNEPEIPSLAAIGLTSMRATDLAGLFALNARRRAVANEYQQLFVGHALDAILMPPAAHTALPLDKWNCCSYTGLWNYLDYPALVLPVDAVRASDAADAISNAHYGAQDAALYSLYTTPTAYAHAPLAVQLVGYRHQDERLLRVAGEVEAIVRDAGRAQSAECRARA